MKEIIQTTSVKVVIVCMLLCSILPLYAADVAINVNGAYYVRTIPDSLYGANMRAWVGYEDGHTEWVGRTLWANMQKATGQTYMRTPGGSWGDTHLWSDMESWYGQGPNDPNAPYTWKVSYPESLNYLTKIAPGARLQPIVNFPGCWYYDDAHYKLYFKPTLENHNNAVNAAVAWVTDQSSRTPTAQYWEIGNEIGGFWEAGFFVGINGTYYGDYFADFYTAMKAVNPDIKIGAVAVPYDRYGVGGERDYVGYWTRDTLEAAFAKGVVPDFLIVHDYPDPSTDAELLGWAVNEIGNFTASMNNIIATSIGSEYVGQIKYCATEWRAGGDRWQRFSGAMFLAQYIMEMARYGWEGSNSFGDFWDINYSTGQLMYTRPDTYVYPFLTMRFGRTMASASTSNWPTVRAYASRDASNTLWVLLCNNNLSAAVTAQVNIAGYVPSGSGEKWMLEGETDATSTLIKINGVTMTAPSSLLTVGTMAGQSIATAANFSYSMPKGSITFIRIPGTLITDPNAPTPNPSIWAQKPYAAGSTSVGMEATVATDPSGVQYYFTCVSGGGHDSGWQSSPSYTDTGLTAGTIYTYTVKTRDLSVGLNETAPSAPASAVPVVPTISIPVGNYSFELPGSGKITGWDNAGKDIPNWSSDTTAVNSGVETGWGPTHGSYTGFLMGSDPSVWSLTSHTIASGEVFDMKIDAKNNSGATTLRASLYYNNGGSRVTVATKDFTLSGSMQCFTVSFATKSAPTSIGKQIGIEFDNVSSGWVGMDNVWLMYTKMTDGDFTGNGMVDMDDLLMLVDFWLENDCNETAGLDLNGDCIISFYEFSLLARNW